MRGVGRGDVEWISRRWITPGVGFALNGIPRPVSAFRKADIRDGTRSAGKTHSCFLPCRTARLRD